MNNTTAAGKQTERLTANQMFNIIRNCAPIVRIDKLTKIYGSGDKEIRALDDITLEIKRGEFLAVVGASGSGKSTFLHMLGAMDRPTTGSIMVDGIDITRMNSTDMAVYRRRKVGFMFQFYNLVSVLNVRDNILLPLSLDGQMAERHYFNDITETLGLADRLEAYPHQLSGGLQQRVAMARALMAKPALILADEPTGNLDTMNSREVVSLLKRTIAKYALTLVLITHDPMIASEADRAIRLSDGKIVPIK